MKSDRNNISVTLQDVDETKSIYKDWEFETPNLNSNQ
jgi:hypothetical protein